MLDTPRYKVLKMWCVVDQETLLTKYFDSKESLEGYLTYLNDVGIQKYPVEGGVSDES